jgi:hypothetical protein
MEQGAMDTLRVKIVDENSRHQLPYKPTEEWKFQTVPVPGVTNPFPPTYRAQKSFVETSKVFIPYENILGARIRRIDGQPLVVEIMMKDQSLNNVRIEGAEAEQALEELRKCGWRNSL